MCKLVSLTNVSLDLSIEDEHAQSHLTAGFAGIWAAATGEASR
jgi:hypothetical protein